MLRSKLFGIAVAVALPVGTPALADPAYTPDQIVDFFAKSVDLGAARGLCIGTESECRSGQTTSKGFDMRVSFDLGSANLTKEARENLEQFAVALKDNRLAAADFIVEGHTDARGGDAYNLSLSEKRALSVRDFLQARGVPAERLRVIGMGKADPRVADPFDAQNRRVEMKVQLR